MQVRYQAAPRPECGKVYSVLVRQQPTDLLEVSNDLAQSHSLRIILGCGNTSLVFLLNSKLCSSERKPLLMHQCTNSADHYEILISIVTAVSSALIGLEFCELLLPISQDVWFYAA